MNWPPSQLFLFSSPCKTYYFQEYRVFEYFGYISYLHRWVKHVIFDIMSLLLGLFRFIEFGTY